MKHTELLFFELAHASMCPENLSYNGISEMQSSESYLMKIESLYSNAVSDLYELNDSQRRIAKSRIDEVRERQMYFDVPTKETVDSLLHDYNSQPEGKRNKNLLEEYRYCQFVLTCVAIQKEYLDKFLRLVTVKSSEEKAQEIATETECNISKVETKDSEWLTVDDVVSEFKQRKNNIKSRQWRIEHGFPYKGFDEKKGAYTSVIFNRKDIENWIRNQR